MCNALLLYFWPHLTSLAEEALNVLSQGMTLFVSGVLTSDAGISPTGNITILLDGQPIAISALVLNGQTATFNFAIPFDLPGPASHDVSVTFSPGPGFNAPSEFANSTELLVF